MLKLNGLEESKKLADLEISSLKNEVAELRSIALQNKHDMNELEQYSRRDCLEIRGVPLPDLESTNAIVVKMAECIDVQLDENDISTSHRLPMRKKTSSQSKRPEQPPAIIVKFISRDKRDELYRARSKLKNLTSADLRYRGPANKLFISGVSPDITRSYSASAWRPDGDSDTNLSGHSKVGSIYAKNTATLSSMLPQ